MLTSPLQPIFSAIFAVVREQKGDFASFLLAIIIVNLALYSTFYIICKVSI